MTEINTERLTLRPLGTEYLESVHEYASDPENTKYMIHLPNESIEETRDFLMRAENEWMPEPGRQSVRRAWMDFEQKVLGAENRR